MSHKNKNTSFDQRRQRVISKYIKRFSLSQVLALFNITKSIVANIVKRFSLENRIELIPQSGRPNLLSIINERIIIKKN